MNKVPEKKVLLVTTLFCALPSKSLPMVTTMIRQAADVARIAKSATGQKCLGVPSQVSGKRTAPHISNQMRYSFFFDIDDMPRSIKLLKFSDASNKNTVHAPICRHSFN